MFATRPAVEQQQQFSATSASMLRAVSDDAFAFDFNFSSLPRPTSHSSAAHNSHAMPHDPPVQRHNASPPVHVRGVATAYGYSQPAASDEGGESHLPSPTTPIQPLCLPLPPNPSSAALEAVLEHSAAINDASMPTAQLDPTPLSRHSSAAQSMAPFAAAAAIPGRRAPRKKRIIRTIEDFERVQRRREQHRVVDYVRRQKESEIVARLQSLIRQQRQRRKELTGEAEDEAVPLDEDDTEYGNRKACRLSVLQSTVALVEQLTAESWRIEGVSATLPKNSKSTATLLSSSTLAPTATYSQLAHLDRSHTLRQDELATFSTRCMLLVVAAAPSGLRILDVNERFLATSGWSRRELLHTGFEESDGTAQPLTPLVSHRRPCRDGRKLLRQYPASTAQLHALQRGEVRKTETVWRAYKRDGRVFEFACTQWAEWDEPADSKRPPERIMVHFSSDDCFILGTVDEADCMLRERE